MKTRATAMARVLRQLRAVTRAPAFKKYLQRLLLELCRIDTTPKPNPDKMRVAEDACFRILERELAQLRFLGQQPRLERRPIDPAIQNHPNFSLLHFTKTPQRPEGLSPEETYEGRSNLLYLINGRGTRAGQTVALNAHIDVVAPYSQPRTAGGIVHGRGSCDDKGPVVAIVGALQLLSQLMGRTSPSWNRNVLAMFVVEEETGGNGSLSLATDRDLKRLYDSILVCECTGLRIHPANRGAVWYRVELKAPEGISVLELAAFIIDELEKEGAAIRAESQHPLFPQRPVQTCHGIIGPFGEHPSRICAGVSFRIILGRKPNEQMERLVVDCLESGLAEYVGLYGDKTKTKDPATGQPMVRRHYDLRRTSFGFEVDVHGAAGHMGGIRERDGAITKMGHLVRSLVGSKARLEALAGGTVRLELGEALTTRRRSITGPARHSVSLVLEGGQGFVPTHTIDEVMDRLRQAAHRGAEGYLRRIGSNETSQYLLTVTYGKLHNVAFDGNPNSRSMRNALAAARTCGLWNHEPVLGWTVSCDARLFASEYPEMDVLTFGPGQLAFAHSDHEQIQLNEIQAAVEFLALFLLVQTGSLEP